MALVNWILGIFFALSGLVFFDKVLIFSLICFVIAALLIPPLYGYISSKLNLKLTNKFRYIIVVILFFIAVEVYPHQLTNQSNKSEVTESEKNNTNSVQINSSEIAITIKPTEIPSLTPTLSPSPTPFPTFKPIPTKIIYPTWTSAPLPPIQTQENPPAVAPVVSSGFSCNCSKTCPQMVSCEEAYFQLNNCGCSARDGDHDGIPCETICP